MNTHREATLCRPRWCSWFGLATHGHYKANIATMRAVPQPLQPPSLPPTTAHAPPVEMAPKGPKFTRLCPVCNAQAPRPNAPSPWPQPPWSEIVGASHLALG